MGVTNRAEDTSNQRRAIDFNIAATATGVTGIIVQVPFNCTLNAVQVAAFGLSGTPTIAIVNNRFIPGAGATAMTVATGTSNTLVAFGTSGVGASGVLIGASFVQLFANDVLMFLLGGTTSAVTGLSGNIAVTPVQDVITWLGNLA